jgi:Restriction endonuclease
MNTRCFESYVQFVFSSLLNMKDEGVVVGRDVQLVDKFGLAHQVDIFYQFERAGITHKVAIECKDRGRPVENGEVAEFYGKLCDAGALRLVMISRSGYQRLAINYAEKHDILLLTSDDLPQLHALVVQRLKSVALPDATATGEPFWTIMELDEDGELTGSYFSHETPSAERKIFLFYCRVHAEQMMSQLQLDARQWAVRGMPRHVFRAFLLILDLFAKRSGTQAAILFKPPGLGASESFLCAPAECGALMAEYYAAPSIPPPR